MINSQTTALFYSSAFFLLCFILTIARIAKLPLEVLKLPLFNIDEVGMPWLSFGMKNYADLGVSHT